MTAKPNRGRTPDGREYWRCARLALDGARRWAAPLGVLDAHRHIVRLVGEARRYAALARAADREGR